MPIPHKKSCSIARCIIKKRKNFISKSFETKDDANLNVLKNIKKLKEKNPKINRSELEIVIDTFRGTIEKALVEERNVEIRGFGSFLVRKIKDKYYARNPKTGEDVTISERRVVTFKSGLKLKNKLEAYDGKSE